MSGALPLSLAQRGHYAVSKYIIIRVSAFGQVTLSAVTTLCLETLLMFVANSTSFSAEMVCPGTVTSPEQCLGVTHLAYTVWSGVNACAGFINRHGMWAPEFHACGIFKVSTNPVANFILDKLAIDHLHGLRVIYWRLGEIGGIVYEGN